MQKLLLALAFAVTMSLAQAQAAIILSTSATNANAGTTLDIVEGQTSSLFTWVSTDAGQTINGLALDILSSEASVLNATAHIINAPAGRWFASGPGTLGDLVDDSNAFTLIAETGISTQGQTDFVLHSEVQFTATAIGTTNITMAPGNQLITSGNTDIGGTITFGTAIVNVSAVPEPGSLCLLGCVLGLGAMRRTRRA